MLLALDIFKLLLHLANSVLFAKYFLLELIKFKLTNLKYGFIAFTLFAQFFNDFLGLVDCI